MVFRSVLLLLIAITALSAGCRNARIQSDWREGEISVDALFSDWTGSLAYFEKPSMFIGFKNDEENIYILVKTVDSRSQMKVMRLGLTIRIEPLDHPEKAWGIHFPVGLKNHGIPLHGVESPGKPTQEEQANIKEMLGRMELLGPGAGQRIETSPMQPAGADYGIRVAIRDTSDVIVYELKLPLRGGELQPYSAWSEPGGKIRLRLETGDIRLWEDKRDPLQYDPNRDTTTGKLRDKGRDRERDRENNRRMTPRMNPLTEPIHFEAEIFLSGRPGGTPHEQQ